MINMLESEMFPEKLFAMTGRIPGRGILPGGKIIQEEGFP